MSLLSRFQDEWTDKQLAPVGSTVLLAVSGGADSMGMAHLFQSAGIPCAVAHCNFGLRGQASDLDEQLVRDWCGQHNITFHHILFDTKAQAASWKKGTQETARDLRYNWFAELCTQFGYARIATAHHANDNVETMLINLFRGTGIAGMHGILPVNGNIIRPLLFATREQMLAYAAEQNVPFRDDASNASDDYLRNAVRHHIIPAAQQWFPGAVTAAADTIAHLADAEMLYKKAMDAERKKLMEKRGQDYYVPILRFRHRQPLATICYELFQPFGFTSRQVPHILALMASESGHFIVSPTHRIIRNRDFLVVTTLPQPTADLLVIDALPCTIEAGPYTYTFALRPRPDVIPAGKDEAWLDSKGITLPLLLRKWRNGDYLYPLGMKMKKKKVSRLLIDEKVSMHEKEELRVLECGKRIAWVPGIRIDERFRIAAGTAQVLVVKRTLSKNAGS